MNVLFLRVLRVLRGFIGLDLHVRLAGNCVRHRYRAARTNVFRNFFLVIAEAPLPDARAKVQRRKQSPVHFLAQIDLVELYRQ